MEGERKHLHQYIRKVLLTSQLNGFRKIPVLYDFFLILSLYILHHSSALIKKKKIKKNTAFTLNRTKDRKNYYLLQIICSFNVANI